MQFSQMSEIHVHDSTPLALSHVWTKEILVVIVMGERSPQQRHLVAPIIERLRRIVMVDFEYYSGELNCTLLGSPAVRTGIT